MRESPGVLLDPALELTPRHKHEPALTHDPEIRFYVLSSKKSRETPSVSAASCGVSVNRGTVVL
jgi:hypothetical protein